METIIRCLKETQYNWVVTGAAGFIGSHLCEFLLQHGQRVKGIDNFQTGSKENIRLLSEEIDQNNCFTFHNIDIRAYDQIATCIQDADFILHQAALGSIPRSIENPLFSHDINVTGTLNVFDAYRQAPRAKALVYASSSAVYGNAPALPKREDHVGQPLSPYAVTKQTNELYAHAYANTYDKSFVGLRYFNVFGPRQSPEGAYAAVIPLWIQAVKTGQAMKVHGDGSTTRDFCYIDNVVFANIAAALSETTGSHVYNVACGERISLNDLALTLNTFSSHVDVPVVHGAFRAGDIQHSLADITAISHDLGYHPLVHVHEGLEKTYAAYGSAKDLNHD